MKILLTAIEDDGSTSKYTASNIDDAIAWLGQRDRDMQRENGLIEEEEEEVYFDHMAEYKDQAIAHLNNQ